MSSDDKQPFLARWSRLKHDAAREGASAAAATPVDKSAPSAPVHSERDLPSLDSLKGLASEYREFLHPKVDDKLRRLALKKLFRDPHFNVMDGLDTYIDDYSKPDPIPTEMLEKLKQANRMLFPDEEAPPQSPAPNAVAGAGGDPGEQGKARAEAPAPGPEDKT
jgi:hypothetical protein